MCISEADLLQTFHQSLAVVEPTPGDRNGVGQHGPDDSYLAAMMIGEVRFVLDLTLLIGKPYFRRAWLSIKSRSRVFQSRVFSVPLRCL